MPEEGANVTLVRALYTALSPGNFDMVCDNLAPNVPWLEAEGFPYADGNSYVGPNAVLNGIYTRLVSEWEGFSEELERVLEAGDYLVTTGYYAGTYRETGESVRAEFAHVWELSEGKVVGFRQYTDTLAFERALHPEVEP